MPFREQKPQERPKERLSIAPLTHTLVPPVQQLRTQMPVWPWLYSAVLGNGHLLVCLDETGSISQLFYPYIDAGPHVRSFLIGIQVSGAVQTDEAEASANQETVSWLAGEGWIHKLRYADGTAAVITCNSSNTDMGVEIEQTMFVKPDSDVFVSICKVTNLRNVPVDCRLVVYAGFDFDYRRSGNTCFFDIDTSVFTFFAFDRYVTLTCNASVNEFDCDKSSIDKLDRVFQDASVGSFSGREYAVGQVSGSVCYDFGRIEAGDSTLRCMYLCFGRSLDEVNMLTSSLAQTKPNFEGTLEWWRTQYAHAQLSIGSSVVREVYDRSLMVLRLLTDSGTGGIIAAPEIDPDFRSCGGYGLCWPRDGAFIASALDVVGQHSHARRFYDWALRVQSPSGVWYQRYYVSGQLAPIWGLVQFDETGSVVWAVCRHIQMTGDISYGQKVFPQLIRACEYMQTALDPKTGLAPMTKDLWEERDGISTYACASTWSGFHELSNLALRLGEATEVERWASAATKLKTAIETHLWLASQKRFLRGINTKIRPYDIERLRHQPDFSESNIVKMGSAGKTRYLHHHDATVDTSILALSVPFGVLSPNDPRIVMTAEAVVKHLTSPIGGILRYQDDAYRNGNPWVICTLWMAWQDLALGQKERACELYNWVLEHRTSLNLLPEQIDRTSGKPCWVIPLAWSHAMFLLVTHAMIEHGLLP